MKKLIILDIAIGIFWVATVIWTMLNLGVKVTTIAGVFLFMIPPGALGMLYGTHVANWLAAGRRNATHKALRFLWRGYVDNPDEGNIITLRVTEEAYQYARAALRYMADDPMNPHCKTCGEPIKSKKEHKCPFLNEAS